MVYGGVIPTLDEWICAAKVYEGEEKTRRKKSRHVCVDVRFSRLRVFIDMRLTTMLISREFGAQVCVMQYKASCG